MSNILFFSKIIFLARLLVLHENTELNIVFSDNTVPSADENEFEKNCPLSINESIFGVNDSLNSPKIWS